MARKSEWIIEEKKTLELKTKQKMKSYGSIMFKHCQFTKCTSNDELQRSCMVLMIPRKCDTTAVRLSWIQGWELKAFLTWKIWLYERKRDTKAWKLMSTATCKKLKLLSASQCLTSITISNKSLRQEPFWAWRCVNVQVISGNSFPHDYNESHFIYIPNIIKIQTVPTKWICKYIVKRMTEGSHMVKPHQEDCNSFIMIMVNIWCPFTKQQGANILVYQVNRLLRWQKTIPF